MTPAPATHLVVVLPFAAEHGGLEQYAVDLAQRSLARGWRTTVVAPHDQPATTWLRRSLEPAAWIAVRATPPDTKRQQARSDHRFWRKDGRRLLAAADVVHLLGKPKSFIREGVLAAERASVPSVYSEIAQITLGYARGSDLSPFRDVCNEVGLATVYCEAAAEDLRTLFGYRGPIRVVDQWLAPDLEAQLLGIDRVPGPLDRPVVIGSLSRLGPEKGLHGLVEAYARLRAATQVPTRLVIGGTGPEHGSLRAAIDDAGLAEHVELAGYVEDKVAFLASIDVFAVTSLVEGGPISGVEAMAAGCAVASTDVGAMAERLAGCPDGELVPPDDPVALAAALDRLTGRAAQGEAGTSLRVRFLAANALAVLPPRMDAVWDEALGRASTTRPRA